MVRVGTTNPRAVDVRILAAANRTLTAEVAAGRFRSDLFFRLAVALIRLPPIIAQGVDLPDLVRQLATHYLQGAMTLTGGNKTRAAELLDLSSSEIPEEVVIPPRLMVTGASGERLLERLESQEAPNRAMRELFGEDPEPAHSDTR